MHKMNIKYSTIARVVALFVTLVNQTLAAIGGGDLPLTENMAYQVISLAVTVIIVAINAWYNNDFTKAAILSGKIFDALKDGRLTEEEIQETLNSVEAEETIENVESN